MKVSWPTKGSVMILKTRAANGSSSSALADVELAGAGVGEPSIGGTSSGDGR